VRPIPLFKVQNKFLLLQLSSSELNTVTRGSPHKVTLLKGKQINASWESYRNFLGESNLGITCGVGKKTHQATSGGNFRLRRAKIAERQQKKCQLAKQSPN
jgi:hypothetical protein